MSMTHMGQFIADPRTAAQSRIETGIGSFTDKVLNTVVEKLSSDGFRQQLANRVIEPTLLVVQHKAKPYIHIMIAAYVLLLILLLIIIYLLIKKK